MDVTVWKCKGAVRCKESHEETQSQGVSRESLKSGLSIVVAGPSAKITCSSEYGIFRNHEYQHFYEGAE